MKFYRFILAVMLPLLVASCGGGVKPDLIPPPTPVNQPDDEKEENNNNGNDQPGEKPWDANRGKIVTPTGTGWSSTKIADGYVYWTFDGKDPVSNAKQRVFIADVDMSSDNYQFKFFWDVAGSITSDVFKNKHAVAAINAGYEKASIVIKADGTYYSAMPNNVIGSTTVPNWKNDGAVYWDGDKDVRLRHDGKGKSISEQRVFYYGSKEPNILTSAPMLIDDFEPVGESFVSYTGNLNSLNYEDPNRHQGVRHPRTVIATTEQNHVLLIAIDGRRSGISEGMTAKEVTGFLVRNFNPQYALNLDGGGSTTLCIKGQGDPTTHVVNYPTDNDKNDHAGERSRDTHFYIVEK